MKIDDIYINEAIRIRKEYITNIDVINDNDAMVKKIITQMDRLAEEFSDVDDISEQEYKNKLNELDNILNRIQTNLLPHHEKIMDLSKDQSKLLVAIKERYEISDEEIQKQIVPYIVKLDEQIRRKI